MELAVKKILKGEHVIQAVNLRLTYRTVYIKEVLLYLIFLSMHFQSYATKSRAAFIFKQ